MRRAGALVRGIVEAMAPFSVFAFATPLAVTSDGNQIFANLCSACHGAEAHGLPGFAPPLAGRNLSKAHMQIIATLLAGLTGKIDVDGESYDGIMPSFAAYSDEEIAAVVNYVVSLGALAAGDKPAAVTVAEVAELRRVKVTPAQLRVERLSKFSDASTNP